MSVAQGIRLHPHHQAFASLRTHLLRSRRMLLTQVVRHLPSLPSGHPSMPRLREQERLMRRSVSHASNCLKNGLRYDARHGGPTPPQKRFTDPESRLPIGS
jgi:hypothetical protein